MLLNEDIIDNWSEALKKIANETKTIEEFIQQSTALIEILKNQDQFNRILDNNRGKINKNKIIETVFAAHGVNQYLINTMKILAENNRFSYIRAILKRLRKKLVNCQNIIYGTAWTVHPLDEKQLHAMELKMHQCFDREIRLVNKLDPSLLGGVQLVVANHVFDGSIKGQLAKLKNDTLVKKN